MPLNRALICQGKLQSVMLQERLSQISEKPPPELYFSDSSTQSPYSVNQSPQSMVYVPMTSETNDIEPEATQDNENILSKALQSIK